MCEVQKAESVLILSQISQKNDKSKPRSLTDTSCCWVSCGSELGFNHLCSPVRVIVTSWLVHGTATIPCRIPCRARSFCRAPTAQCDPNPTQTNHCCAGWACGDLEQGLNVCRAACSDSQHPWLEVSKDE